MCSDLPNSYAITECDARAENVDTGRFWLSCASQISLCVIFQSSYRYCERKQQQMTVDRTWETTSEIVPCRPKACTLSIVVSVHIYIHRETSIHAKFLKRWKRTWNVLYVLSEKWDKQDRSRVLNGIQFLDKRNKML